jgi:hypothetical protein
MTERRPLAAETAGKLALQSISHKYTAPLAALGALAPSDASVVIGRSERGFGHHRMTKTLALPSSEIPEYRFCLLKRGSHII